MFHPPSKGALGIRSLPTGWLDLKQVSHYTMGMLLGRKPGKNSHSWFKGKSDFHSFQELNGEW